MSKLWQAIKDLERERERRAMLGEHRPGEGSEEGERSVAYLEGIRERRRRQAGADGEQ